MLEDNLRTESYLLKIAEQNETIINQNKKIIDVLEKLSQSSLSKQSIETETNEIKKVNADKMDRLSRREHQIMELILEGKLNKEIAYAFSISISTVETHRSNIMRKLEASNVAQLIKIYLQCQESMK